MKTPPFSAAARFELGDLLRKLQRGERLAMPHSRPMPSIGPGVHELRVRDDEHSWRLVYRFDPEAIIVVDIFSKTTQQTPKHVIDACPRRLRAYDATENSGGAS